MEKPLLEQFGRQRCGVFLSAKPKDLEALQQWLRLVDFHCEWVWGGRQPCCQVLVHMNVLYRPELERLGPAMSRRFGQKGYLFVDENGQAWEFSQKGGPGKALGPLTPQVLDRFYSDLLGEPFHFQEFRFMYHVNTGAPAIMIAQHIHEMMVKYEDWDVRFVDALEDPEESKER